MKLANKTFSAMIVLICLVLAACSGVPGGNGAGSGSGSGSGGGSTTGPFTISVKVSGLSGTGLVVANNATDKLTITANGTFPFTTKVTAYAVTVVTQPTNPQQTCAVTSGTGTATAAVTVVVSCATGTYTVGGQVTGLVGSGLVLQNNGKDNLTITTNGTFTFATPANLNDPYSITVLVQPTKPSQVCTVAMGSGTVSQNVGTPVVTCTVGTIPVGGSVSGLAGTGMVLQNNGGDNYTVIANGSFQFPTLLVAGQTYNATILTQPTTPPQVCNIANNQGTVPAGVAAVTTIQITCKPVLEPIGGQVVGMSIPTGLSSQMVLQNNSGDNLPISGNGAFTFVTNIPYGNSYDVSIFVASGTQDNGCIVWNYQGQALGPVADVTVDCGHNDWAWLNGANTSNQNGTFSPVTPPITAFIANTPGGRKYSASWSDSTGRLWLFGGYGYTYNTQQGPQPFFLDEMWKYQNAYDYSGGIFNYWTFVSPLPPPAPVQVTPSARWGSVTWTDASDTLWLFGGQDAGLNFLNDLWEFNTTTATWTCVSGCLVPVPANGVYGTMGQASAQNVPGGRWGSTLRFDKATGAVWLFGGFGYDAADATPGLLNDLWEFSGGQWTWVSGSNSTNVDGSYPQTVGTPGGYPGGRQAMVSWLDNSGNFWIFGGYNLSGTGQPNSFNDLWEYNVGSSQWTWVSGANTVNQIGVFGTQGVSAPTNLPGSRWSSASWTDAQGNLWLFGGQGYDGAGNGSIADLWAFNPNQTSTDPSPGLPAPGQWVWVKGPSAFNQAGVYGLNPANEFGTFWPDVTNYPGTRYGAAYWYVPVNDSHLPIVANRPNQPQFFMFGGEGNDSTTSNGNGLLNDLWRYFPYP